MDVSWCQCKGIRAGYRNPNAGCFEPFTQILCLEILTLAAHSLNGNFVNVVKYQPVEMSCRKLARPLLKSTHPAHSFGLPVNFPSLQEHPCPFFKN